MSTLLERLLTWLAALGCPVVLLSATLPAATRLKLLAAYAASKEIDLPPTVSEPGYPRMTVLTPGAPPVVTVSHPKADESRRRVVRLGWVTQDRLAGELQSRLKDGGCAVVIRNTVGLAQETFVELRAKFGKEIRVELFHARFPFGRRQEIESAVLERFGKAGGPAERDRRVLVATQVVEQSLDLDFDLMVSDVAPVDLVLQRAGRLHRHDRGTRPNGVKTPELLLFVPDRGPSGLPEFGPSRFVYSRHVLFRSLVVLRGARESRRSSVLLPDDIEGMVEAVYAETPPTFDLGHAERSFWEETGIAHQRAIREEVKAAAQFVIPEPVDEDGILERFNRELNEDDDPNVPPARRAMTRLADWSVQVVLVYETTSGLALDPDDRCHVDLGREPDLAKTRLLLLNAVTLNHRGLVAHYAALDPPPGWRRNGLLRHCRPIRLRPDGVSSTGEYRLQYSEELGIRFTRPDEEQQ